MSVTAAQFVRQARTWLGVPWVHQGRTREGVDCVGLLVCAARDLQLAAGAVEIVDYGRQPAGGRLRRLCAEHLVERQLDALAPGAIVLMRFDVEPQHVGILGDYPGGGLSLIHSIQQHGKVVEHRLADVWRARIVAVFGVPGVQA